MYANFIYNLTGISKIDKDSRNFAFGYQEKLFKERKEFIYKNKREETDEEYKKKQKIFVDQLIYNEDKFTDATIRDNLALLLLAGFETTANQTAHTILMLAMHPEVQEKCYKEINEVFGSNDVEFSGEVLNTLKYLDQVVRETMRVFPIVPMITRQLVEDMELDGYNFPKGTIIFMNIAALHRRSDYWGEDSDVFDPEHFSPDNTNVNPHPYAFIPFSAGKRNCTGQ
jgi:cytochrome P450